MAKKKGVILKNSKINLAQYETLEQIFNESTDSTVCRLLMAFAKDRLDVRIAQAPKLSKFDTQYLEDVVVLSGDKEARNKIGQFLKDNTNTRNDRWNHLMTSSQ